MGESTEHRITNEIVRKSLAAEFGVGEGDVKVKKFEVTGI